MKKVLNQLFFTLFCCSFLWLLLFYSQECILLASKGLLIWYKNMIPTLFPFMVLSGFMIRTGLSIKIGHWMQPVLGIFFRLPSQMLYGIFMGFLCGFPMGAKIVADMLEKEQITRKEGEYLLAFCNNIGPLYMLGYVIPLFNYEGIWYVLAYMYLVPLLYGLLLRYTYFHNISNLNTFFLILKSSAINKQKLNSVTLSSCSHKSSSVQPPNYFYCFQQSLTSAIEQITLLGGCMVFFNCMQIYPQILRRIPGSNSSNVISPLFSAVLCSFIEIGGGLQQLADTFYKTGISAFIPLSLVTFGGLSCIVQTFFIIKNTGLKISTYLKHKIVQTCIFILLLLLHTLY